MSLTSRTFQDLTEIPAAQSEDEVSKTGVKYGASDAHEYQLSAFDSMYNAVIYSCLNPLHLRANIVRAIAFARIHSFTNAFAIVNHEQQIIGFCKENGVGLELVPRGRGLQPPSRNKPEL